MNFLNFSLLIFKYKCLSIRFFFISSPENTFSLLLEREEGRKREREKHQCERETLVAV